MRNFTERELAIAKSVDLVAVAQSLGYTPVRIGQYYTLKEMDSMRIYDRSHWCRFSRKGERGENGGSQIDFLRVFGGMDVKAAVFWLLEFSGYKPDMDEREPVTLKHQVEKKEHTRERKEFILPQAEENNYHLYRYLLTDRGLDRKVVDFFLQKGLIYSSIPYHNIVFKGNDKNGVTRFASMRGVFDRQGKPFKCDVAGNDKRYGFNISNNASDEVNVFEAAIDLMSYMDIYKDFDNNMLALGMLGDAPLETFLKEHGQIGRIRFCLDNDEPGREATERLMEKYAGLGYAVEDAPPPPGYKDYNEWLVKAKREPVQENNGQIPGTQGRVRAG